MDHRAHRHHSIRAAIAVLVLASLCAAASAIAASQQAYVPLYTETVALGADSVRIGIPPGSANLVLPASRVLATAPDAAALVAAENAWLDSGARWTAPSGMPYDDMIRTSLLDIHTLTEPNGAILLGWEPRWRYVWPRDGAFIATSLVASGHLDDALGLLKFLQSVQDPSGYFQARYLPDGSGPPDDRGVQLDGTGWVLWAAGQLAHMTDSRTAAATLTQIRPMIDTSTNLILDLLEDPSGLPPASADFWEVPESTLTLGIAAPLLDGLYGAAAAYGVLGDEVAAARAADAAAALQLRIDETFGSHGYSRMIDGGGRDTSVAFLLPPFVPAASFAARPQGEQDALLAAFDGAAAGMRRPAGGLAPGEDWKRDGISWTPTTAIFALVDATLGRSEQARERMDWLDAHRTAAGSLPEKVLYDGSPAAVAPLTWSSAIVILTAKSLQTSP